MPDRKADALVQSADAGRGSLTKRPADDLVSRGLADLQALNQTVVFPDKRLEAAVREQLEKPEGALTKTDLETLKTLEVHQGDIQDLTGLEYCVNLTTLNLWLNQITDATPLAGLTQLEELWLGKDQIADLTPLAGLTQVHILGLESNQITDLTPLAGLTQVTWLDLRGSKVEDLTPLLSLNQLRVLRVTEPRDQEAREVIATLRSRRHGSGWGRVRVDHGETQ